MQRNGAGCAAICMAFGFIFCDNRLVLIGVLGIFLNVW